jgi:hypothetical protein
MATTIPDLWSDDIKVNVLPPLVILKAQEGSLARRTKGMLQARLTTVESGKRVQHQLDVIAPSLDAYRERLLSAAHDREMLYPVTVVSEAFVPEPTSPLGLPGTVQAVSASQRQAVTDDDFIQLVREVLHSRWVRALIHSLIARINAQTSDTEANATEQQDNSPDSTGPDGE